MNIHTPGPWEAQLKPLPEGKKMRDQEVTVVAPSGEICTVSTRPVECGGNAHLIASAPDLYAALKDLVDGNDSPNLHWDPRWIAASEAIRKAEGIG
jgi:hypothetical protein